MLDTNMIFTQLLDGVRWLNPSAIAIGFLPEIFFLCSTIVVFLIWLKKVQYRAQPDMLKEYITILVGICLFTIYLIIVNPFFPLAFGGYAEQTSMLLQITLYTQVVKILILIAMSLFLLFGKAYFEDVFFAPIYDGEQKKYRLNLKYVEYFFLMQLGLVFLFILISSLSLITVIISLEGISFCSYILISYNTTSKYSLEAAIKYFMYGALAFGFMCLGSFLVYLTTGGVSFYHLILVGPKLFPYTPIVMLDFEISGSFLQGVVDAEVVSEQAVLYLIGILLILGCLLFKIGAAPFHFWVADVYEGAPLPTTVYMSSILKLGFCGLFLKMVFWVFAGYLHILVYFLLFCGLLSLAVGAWGAVMQKKIKRFMAYSSINHMGFLLLGLAFGGTRVCHELSPLFNSTNLGSDSLLDLSSGYAASLLYLVLYTFGNLLFFLVVMSMSSLRTGQAPTYFIEFANFLDARASDYSSFRLPISISLVLIIFSLAGVPPVVGFFAKYAILEVVVRSPEYGFLIFYILFFTVLSVFYYLRVLKVIFFEKTRVLSNLSLITGSLGQGKWWKRQTYWLLGLTAILLLGLPWLGFNDFLFFINHLTMSLVWPEMPFSFLSLGGSKFFYAYQLPPELQLAIGYLDKGSLQLGSVVDLPDPVDYKALRLQGEYQDNVMRVDQLLEYSRQVHPELTEARLKYVIDLFYNEVAQEKLRLYFNIPTVPGERNSIILSSFGAPGERALALMHSFFLASSCKDLDVANGFFERLGDVWGDYNLRLGFHTKVLDIFHPTEAFPVPKLTTLSGSEMMALPLKTFQAEVYLLLNWGETHQKEFVMFLLDQLALLPEVDLSRPEILQLCSNFPNITSNMYNTALLIWSKKELLMYIDCMPEIQEAIGLPVLLGHESIKLVLDDAILCKVASRTTVSILETQEIIAQRVLDQLYISRFDIDWEVLRRNIFECDGYLSTRVLDLEIDKFSQWMVNTDGIGQYKEGPLGPVGIVLPKKS